MKSTTDNLNRDISINENRKYDQWLGKDTRKNRDKEGEKPSNGEQREKNRQTDQIRTTMTIKQIWKLREQTMNNTIGGEKYERYRENAIGKNINKRKFGISTLNNTNRSTTCIVMGNIQTTT